MSTLDTLGRPLRSLRLSVTDRCNLRCHYCMPEDEYVWLPREDVLSFEETVQLADLFGEMGVDRLRITGGEPLLRRDLPSLVAQLAARPWVRDLALTTNGVLLADAAPELKAAGLHRVTVSLDTVRPDRFVALTRRDALPQVLSGIDAVRRAGFTDLKIDSVITKGDNDDELGDLLEYGRSVDGEVRFIEYMDVGATNGWRMDDVVPAAEIVRAIDLEMPLIAADPNYSGEVAQRWRYRDGVGEVGVIASVTQAFCSDCTRARLSTEGKLYTCLFATSGYDLRALVRGGSTDDELGNAIAAIWRQRSDRYSEVRTSNTARLQKVEMSYIGG